MRGLHNPRCLGSGGSSHPPAQPQAQGHGLGVSAPTRPGGRAAGGYITPAVPAGRRAPWPVRGDAPRAVGAGGWGGPGRGRAWGQRPVWHRVPRVLVPRRCPALAVLGRPAAPALRGGQRPRWLLHGSAHPQGTGGIWARVRAGSDWGGKWFWGLPAPLQPSVCCQGLLREEQTPQSPPDPFSWGVHSCSCPCPPRGHPGGTSKLSPSDFSRIKQQNLPRLELVSPHKSDSNCALKGMRSTWSPVPSSPRGIKGANPFSSLTDDET